MANLQLALEVRRAVTKKPNRYPSKKGRCQQLQRECAVTVYDSNKFFVLDDGSNPPDAVAAAKHLKETGHAHDYNGDPQSLEEGDLLYKTEGSGGFGHVGNLLDKSDPDWRNWPVGENSTYHARRDAKKRGVPLEQGDARGIRTLGEFGAFQVVGRLPVALTVPAPRSIVPTLDFEGTLLDVKFVQDAHGHLLVPVREFADAMGWKTGFNPATGRVHLEREAV